MGGGYVDSLDMLRNLGIEILYFRIATTLSKTSKFARLSPDDCFYLFSSQLAKTGLPG